jgi:uncharacterized damage-inducible protein DinB
MTEPGLTLVELLNWNDETTRQWLRFLAETPALQQQPCGIYGTANVLELARHIVFVSLRHSQRLAGLPTSALEDVPADSVPALEELHAETVARLRRMLTDPAQPWDSLMEFSTLSAGQMQATRRKVVAHALLHGVRHWAQVSTLARATGFSANIAGDLMASSALE